MNEICILKELNKTITRADEHARACAVSIGKKEDRQHACRRDGTALRHLVKTHIGKNGCQRNAESCISKHTGSPTLFVLGDGKDNDTKDKQCGDYAPGDRRNLGEFGEHRKSPLLMDYLQFADREKSRAPYPTGKDSRLSI